MRYHGSDTNFPKRDKQRGGGRSEKIPTPVYFREKAKFSNHRPKKIFAARIG
jgi:hypothetical protein